MASKALPTRRYNNRTETEMSKTYDPDYELTDREIEFKAMDKNRLLFLGDHRCYRLI